MIASNRSFSNLLVLGTLGAATIVLGAAAAEFGMAALLAGAALVSAGSLLWRPYLGLCLLVALIPVQNVLLVMPGVSLARLVGVALFAAWGAQKVIRRESLRSIIGSGFTWVGGGFVILAIVSESWAQVPGIALAGSQQLLMMFGVGVLIIDVVRSWRVAELVVKSALVGGVAASVLVVGQYLVLGASRAGDDIAGGINNTASLLLTLIPFGFHVFRSSRSFGWRMLGGFYVVGASLGVILSFSRFNLLILPIVLVALSVETWLEGRGRASISALLVTVCIGGLVFVPWESVEQRAATILPYFQRTLSIRNSEAAIDSERGFHLRVGLAIARDHPVIGAGYRNYRVLFRDEYQFRVSGSDRVYIGQRSPHSSYVGILADLGLVGLGLWVVLLFGVGIRGLLKSLGSMGQAKGSHAHSLVRALLLALGLQVIAYGWYAPTDTDTLFWTVLALSVAVQRLTLFGSKRGSPANKRLPRNQLFGAAELR